MLLLEVTFHLAQMLVDSPGMLDALLSFRAWHCTQTTLARSRDECFSGFVDDDIEDREEGVLSSCPCLKDVEELKTRHPVTSVHG